MRTLYSFSIICYRTLIHFASVFDRKAKLWIRGRKNIFKNLDVSLSVLHATGKPVAWFHCASLGEFEQGRQLIENYHALQPDHLILLTFFSPSGYEIRKNYKGADHICYLPLDTPGNAEKFLNTVKPSIAFFVKYEFWFNFLSGLKERKVPTYLVSGIFRDEQHFFKWYGAWFRKQMSCFTHFFLQDEHSEQLLRSIGFKNITVTGDTRFDRVAEIAENVKAFPLIEKFKDNNKIFIAGSTWKEDEQLISELADQDYKLIIAPHEIEDEHIDFIVREFSKKGFSCLRYSAANDQTVPAARVLIIDNIGMLSSLYQYGTIAFIGGGFGEGIHNILEAATFGLPVMFGPNYEKFAEAKDLIRLGGALSVADKKAFNRIVLMLNDPDILKTASHISKHYVQSRRGATERILKAIGLK